MLNLIACLQALAFLFLVAGGLGLYHGWSCLGGGSIAYAVLLLSVVALLSERLPGELLR